MTGEWTWTCPCGRIFDGDTVEDVERQRRRHRNRHIDSVRAMVGGEPAEGWHPGYNC